jgi:YgiT-type zinc finger domain-containing protein
MSIRCYFCGADTEARSVTVDERWEGRLVSVEDVPADVCPQCGEVYYGPEAVRRLEELRRQRPPATTIQVPVYTFAADRAAPPETAKTPEERPVAGRSQS